MCVKKDIQLEQQRKFIKIFGLEKENIKFRYKYTSRPRVLWVLEGEFWLIDYDNKFHLLHELGHLFIDNNPQHYCHSIALRTIVASLRFSWFRSILLSKSKCSTN